MCIHDVGYVVFDLELLRLSKNAMPTAENKRSTVAEVKKGSLDIDEPSPPNLGNFGACSRATSLAHPTLALELHLRQRQVGRQLVLNRRLVVVALASLSSSKMVAAETLRRLRGAALQHGLDLASTLATPNLPL